MQKGLEYMVLGALFLLTLIPLVVVPDTFFPFIVGKALMFRVLVEIAAIGFVLLLLSSRTYNIRVTPLTVVFGSFVVVMLMADLLGINPVKSIWSNFERMEGWITLIHLFVLFIVAEHMLMKHWKRFMQVSLGVSVLVALYGLLQIAGVYVINQGGVRVDSTFGNATYLSVYALFHFFFACWCLVGTRVRTLWFVYGAIALLQIVVIYLTATRGALLGLAVGVGIAWLWYGLVEKNVRALIALGLTIFMGLSVFGVLVSNKESTFIKSSPTLDRIATLSVEAGSVRFTLWNIALQGVLERPLLGWGQGNFTPVFGKYYDPSLYAQEPWFDRPHNAVVNWFVAGGIAGGVLYFLLIGVAGYAVVRMRTRESAVVLGLLVAYVVQNLFVFDNTMSYVLFALVLAWVSSTMVPVRAVTVSGVFTDGALRGAGVALGVALCIGMWSTLHAPLLAANTALSRGLNGALPVEERLESFVEAATYTEFADQEVREHFMQFTLGVLGVQNLPISFKEEVVRAALPALKEQAERMEHSPRTQLFYGLLLRSVGFLDEAEVVLQRALELAPQKQSVLFELGALYLSMEQYDVALEYFQHAYESAPEFTDAAVLYGVGLLYAEGVESAEVFYIERFGYVPVLEDSVVRSYVMLGFFSEYYEAWDAYVAVEGESREARELRSAVEAFEAQ